MARVQMKSYISPTLVLLAFDWPEGGAYQDFLGFAISRKPGFQGEAESWLPNRIGFSGPAPPGRDFPTNTSPIQKFLWWDARIDDEDRGKTFTYRAVPVRGTPDAPVLVEQAATTLRVKIPQPLEGPIGTYFNRAVVSSQAFSRKFGQEPRGKKLHEALAWLANGLEQVIPDFLDRAESVEGAIYHLTDDEWVIPALERFGGQGSLVYNKTKKDQSNAAAVDRLQQRIEFLPRTKAAIMHNKFLVKTEGGKPVAVLTGSANFTTGGLATQANLLHTFRSRDLAALYRERKELLEGDPTVAKTAAQARWSKVIPVGDARVRVFFSPEKKDARVSIDTVVKAVKAARKSVLFCLFSPTDRALREAIFEAGDRGKMMFGLINKLSAKEPADGSGDAAARARVELYHRSRQNRDVFAHDLYPRGGAPGLFWWEVATLPGDKAEFPVYIHHKFVVVDAETDAPTIFTGSANMSENALHRNDENLLEITRCPRLAAMYLAELMRLYEHYRARAAWNRWKHKKEDDTYQLKHDARWARAAYTRGTPQYKSRVNMVGS